MLETLVLIFFIIAIFYSMCGFGGGSSYIAFLALFSVPYQYIPSVALCCNITVSGLAFYTFWKNGLFKFDLFLPLIITSVPAAFIAGTIPVSKTSLLFILSTSLFIAGLRMLILKNTVTPREVLITPMKRWIISLALGLLIGGLSGIVGIGGGIFLAPILTLYRWAKPKEIAAICSGFIFVNSVAGLSGQLAKLTEYSFLFHYGILVFVVFLGGFIGSNLSSKKLSQSAVKMATACLIIFISVRIFVKAAWNV